MVAQGILRTEKLVFYGEKKNPICDHALFLIKRARQVSFFLPAMMCSTIVTLDDTVVQCTEKRKALFLVMAGY